MNEPVLIRKPQPARPVNQAAAHLRAYRRALRAAESLAWESRLPRPTTPPSPEAEASRPLQVLFSLVVLAALLGMAFGELIPFDLRGW